MSAALRNPRRDSPIERVFDVVHTVLDFADSRAAAWAVAVGAAVVTGGAWWFALTRDVAGLPARVAAAARITSADTLFALVAVFAPFVAVNALWLAVAPPADAGKSGDGHGPLRVDPRHRAEQQRQQRMLIAAVIGVLNGFAIYVATH